MKKLIPIVLVLGLTLSTGCVGLGDSAGYIKKNGGITSAYTLKGVTVTGNLVFKGDSKETSSSQGGALSPEDSLNGNSMDPKAPLSIPEMPEAPKDPLKALPESVPSE